MGREHQKRLYKVKSIELRLKRKFQRLVPACAGTWDGRRVSSSADTITWEMQTRSRDCRTTSQLPGSTGLHEIGHHGLEDVGTVLLRTLLD